MRIRSRRSATRHAARGLDAIDAHTAFPRWDGTPVDYGLAVQALLGSGLANPSPG